MKINFQKVLNSSTTRTFIDDEDVIYHRMELVEEAVITWYYRDETPVTNQRHHDELEAGYQEFVKANERGEE